MLQEDWKQCVAGLKKNRGEESTEFGGKENSKNTLINSKLKFYVKKFIAESEAGRPTGFLS